MKTQTEPDPIVEELHAIRREIAARFDNDVHRIAEDARRRQAAGGEKMPQSTPATESAVPVASCTTRR